MTVPSLLIAFLAGFISFLSPCILPIIPGFIAYISGEKLSDSTSNKRRILLSSIFFVLGFALVFAILGVLISTILATISLSVISILGKIGGSIIIIFGLYLLGVFKFTFLQKDHKVKIERPAKVTYFTSFIIGASFAVSWTPCMGAILGSILTLAITTPTLAFFLLLSYAFGFGLPIILVGIFTTQILNVFKRYSTFMGYFNIFAGIFLIILGVLVFTNNVGLLMRILQF